MEHLHMPRLFCLIQLIFLTAANAIGDVTILGQISDDSELYDPSKFLDLEGFDHIDFAHTINPSLTKVRPYPTDKDVCHILGRSPVADFYVRKNIILIGCPSHEPGAIEDRIREGLTVVVELVGYEENFGYTDWTLLRLPN